MREDFGKRLPVDTRIIEDIRRSPTMSAEQGPAFMPDWGGPSAYQEMARWPASQRMTWFAVQEGYTTETDIADATGLRVADVSKALTALHTKGLVVKGVVSE